MQDIRTVILSRELRAYIAQKRMEQRMLEERYNPYHDPRNGRFTTGKGSGGVNGVVLAVGKGQKGKGYYADTKDADNWKVLARKGATQEQLEDLINGKNVASHSIARDENSSMAKALGKDRYTRVCEQIEQCDNDSLKQFYAQDLNHVDVYYKGIGTNSYQKPGRNYIEIGDPGSDTMRGRSENSVIFHEDAHNVDNVLGQKSGGHPGEYYSTRWNNGEFGKALQSEADEYINNRHKALNNEYQTHKTDAAWLRENAAKPDGNNWFSDETIITVYGQHKSFPKKYAYASVASEIRQYVGSNGSNGNNNTSASHQGGCISDIMGLATNNRAKDGFGHDNSYAKNKNNLPKESFAEFSECTVAGHTDLIKQYFPKSYAAYENMLNDAAKL